ncbi:MAG: hypothetical protein PHS09_00795 [Candidatus Omnitrophica bacterium]|nr:hypothetical protein [Candidatus Omnitrophota bacterium]
MPSRIDKHIIWNLLPAADRLRCRVGICRPAFLDRLPRVYLVKNKQWSVGPSRLFPKTRSIIVLIHFSPVSNDYRVEKIILKLASRLWRRLKLKTHVINRDSMADPSRLIGMEEGPAAKRYSGMILLKELGYYSGLGQYGKSGLLINREFGSDFKIQALFSEAELKYDRPLFPRKYPGCSGCDLCLDLCPGEAISNYRLDPLKCHIWKQPKTIFRRPLKPYLFSLIPLKIPKARGYSFDPWCCRNCQAFCKANAAHYLPLSSAREAKP